MKVGIIGDTHFGASFNLGKTDPITQLNSRLLDYSKTFNSIIDNFISRGVSLVVLTGDIFETRHPTSSQLNMFSKCIQRVLNLGIEIVIVVGNHDQQRTIDTTTVDLFGSLKLPKLSVYPNMAVHSLSEDLHLILMPYRDRRMMGTELNSHAIKILDDQLQDLIKPLLGRKILVGHLMLEKTMGEDNPDSFSINELILPLSMFDNIDATIMGHVHKHSVVSKSNPVIIYSGSMEKGSFGEKDHKKVSVVIDTNNIDEYEIIPTNVRDLFEMNFDYSIESFKSEINDKIIKDIDEYNTINDTHDSIVKLIVKVDENDIYYIDQQRIKDHIFSKNVSYLYGIQIISTQSRQLRDSSITEDSDSKKAMIDFISNLAETETAKVKLTKCASDIINEVEGK